MTEETTEKQIDNDQVICPITLELFRDPVRANDGHVYERQAITRWIIQHGTSPLTRQPLEITDLRADEQLKNLARQGRRSSGVSYSSRNEEVTLPPLRRIQGNFHRVAPAGIFNSSRGNHSSNKSCWQSLLIFIVCILLPLGATIVSFIGIRNSQGGIISLYNGQLTSNSLTFNRLSPSNSGQFYYDRIEIIVSQNGSYEFTSSSNIDMYAYLYQNNFNYTNVNLNLLISDDNSGRLNQFDFRYSLQSSSNYILVATTSSNLTRGTFTIRIQGPSTVKFN